MITVSLLQDTTPCKLSLVYDLFETALKMTAVSASDTVVRVCQHTLRHKRQGCNIYQHCCKKFKLLRFTYRTKIGNVRITDHSGVGSVFISTRVSN